MKFKLFLLCHSLNAERFEFHYTFQGTEFGNGISSFHSIFFIVFCPRKPFCAPCVMDSFKSISTIPLLKLDDSNWPIFRSKFETFMESAGLEEHFSKDNAPTNSY